MALLRSSAARIKRGGEVISKNKKKKKSPKMKNYIKKYVNRIDFHNEPLKVFKPQFH